MMMQKTTTSYQDTILSKTRKAGVYVTVFLMNGFQMHGVITGYDNFVIVLNSEGKQQMIYKHAISTIAPTRPVDLGDEEYDDAQFCPSSTAREF